jgi:histidine triad (HIT) family protein
MSDCIFCQIIAGTIPSKKVMEDDDVVVIHDINPAAPIHLLVLSKQHFTDITDMPEEIYIAYMEKVRNVIAQEKVTQFRLVHNGKGAQFVPHAHIHIMGSIAADRKL